MKIHHLFILSAGLLISANAMADGADLAKKSGCMTCHAVDHKLVGPSFKDVANKYGQDTEAAAKLEKKVREGGSGSFGKTPMLATQKTVSDDDIKTIVAWILQLK